MGEIKTITAKGHLVVKSSFAPPVGTELYTPAFESVGEIRKILGPVNAPYLVLAPHEPGVKLNRLIGTKLYMR